MTKLFILSAVVVGFLSSPLSTFACGDSDEIVVHEKTGNTPWEVEITDDSGKKQTWFDDDGLLTLVAAVQSTRRKEPSVIKSYQKVVEKSLARFAADIKAIVKKFKADPQATKEQIATVEALAKSSAELLTLVKKESLQQKHIDFIDKSIAGPILKFHESSKTNLFGYEVKVANGKIENRGLTTYPAFESFDMNSRGLYARGGCGANLKFMSSDQKPTDTGTDISPAVKEKGG